MEDTIYGQSDVARALGVTRAVVHNWLTRKRNLPEPTYHTPDGVPYWDSLEPWYRWRGRR